jgi:hypothetical protein
MITVQTMLPQGQKANAFINPTGTNPLTGEAVPAQIDGPGVWTEDGSGVISLEVSEDGKNCSFVPTGVEGAYSVTVTIDADLGEGVVPISETFIGLVANPQADSVGAGVEVVNV